MKPDGMHIPVMYPGVHQTTLARHVSRCMISVNILIRRVSDFEVGDWIMDSGAFTRISTGKDHLEPGMYAEIAHRWHGCGNLQAVVSQDWMCEPFVLAVTGGTVQRHQDQTTERYLDLRTRIDTADGPYLMPVLQGYTPEQYAAHARDLSPFIGHNAWVGVGSVCKRQGRPDSLAAVLEAIHDVRPDWRLHGFGVKSTSLRSSRVCDRLATVDSMAWSYAARMQRLASGEGPSPNSAEALLGWMAKITNIRPDGHRQQTLT
ncbi:MAG: hypothetical protein F4Z29_07495 [Gemmatimonadetes bacterium]|nr:hypothetical protein [Gemmatimonadota bacterium]